MLILLLPCESTDDAARQARADRVAAIRRARNWVHDDEALAKVFGEYADRFRTRPGGYTRIIKAGFRPGDNAEMAIIALVGDESPSNDGTDAADAEATVAYDGTENV